jgi:tRNA A37 methylthiotransferase MiaB
MYHKVISNLLNVGINCSCCFIVGYPGETSQTFEKTVDFIESIPQDSQEGIFYWSIYPFLLAPLSEIYTPEERSKYRLEGYMQNWSHNTMNSGEATNQIINAFLNIKNSSPIYSGDNIDMLTDLSIKDRKKFVNSRHDLAKHFLNNSFDKNKVLNVFSPILDIKGHVQ